MTQTQQYGNASGRAVAKYGFVVHAAIYAAVMGMLAVINLLTSPGVIWFIWPLVGWGVFLALHGLRVYLLADKFAIVDMLTERELHHLGADQTDRGAQRDSAAK